MPNITGTVVELIYANTASGAAQNTFTAERTLFTTAEMGERPVIPPYYFAPNAGVGSGILVRASGIVSSTATPTYTFTCRLGTNGSTTAVIALGSGAITAQSGITNQLWEFSGAILVRTLATAGASSTIQGLGSVGSPGGLTASASSALWGNATQPGTVATFDPSITNYVNLNITCSASSASNSITLLQLLVYGLR